MVKLKITMRVLMEPYSNEICNMEFGVLDAVANVNNGRKANILIYEKMKNLLIVESPTKVKSIQKFLGDDFKVLASIGHVRDLVSSSRKFFQQVI